jgi:hypothetical protein
MDNLDNTNENTGSEAPATIDDVARSLVEPASAPEGTPKSPANEEAEDTHDDSEEASVSDDFDDLFGEDTSDPQDSGEGDTSNAQDESPDDEDYEDTSSAVSDHATVKVTVDGEEQEVSIADLKRRYAGEGAIEKRLQEATEARKTAAEQARINREQMENIVKAVSEILFTPSVRPPDVSLMEQDPTAYLLAKDAYDAEMGLIQQRKAGIQNAMQHMHQEADNALAEVRRLEGEKLKSKLPILKDPQKGPKFRDEFVRMLTDDYGFSMEDLNSAVDHRLFVVAADALRYKMLKSKGDVKVKKTKARVAPKQSKKPASNAIRQQVQKAYARARETGSVDDVAATLIAPPKRRR